MGNKMDNKTHAVISILLGLLWILMAFWRRQEGESAAMTVLFVLVGVSFLYNGIRYWLRAGK